MFRDADWCGARQQTDSPQAKGARLGYLNGLYSNQLVPDGAAKVTDLIDSLDERVGPALNAVLIEAQHGYARSGQ